MPGSSKHNQQFAGMITQRKSTAQAVNSQCLVAANTINDICGIRNEAHPPTRRCAQGIKLKGTSRPQGAVLAL